MSETLERFGKYLILDHLVDGGMAKICRARHLGEQANKIVAIKMVQPQFSKDPSFVQMFEDELKVTFGLMHPNIAQVYDYGMVDHRLYSAMEYVDGANLKQFLDRLKQKNFVFPAEISAYIISQVSQALHYAHTFQDQLTAKPFNIIHRDISPHNIMLTYDGAVKVIDFGIAKADSNSEATQAGTIKGKLSYLAPEYLDGLELDHRYDQFAVGITLWEMLCSRKLFQAKNDLAVLKQIQNCKIPRPSSINPNVPKELDEIILKALSKDRNDRYENMDKLNRALVKFLYSNYPDFNATDLGYFAKQLFKEEISKDRKKFVEFGKIDITPFLAQMQQGRENSGVVATSTVNQAGKIEIDLGDFKEEAKEGTSLDLDIAEKTKTKTKRVQSTASAVNKTDIKKARKVNASSSGTQIRRNSSYNKRKESTEVVKKGGRKGITTIIAASIISFVLFETGFLGKEDKSLVRNPAEISEGQEFLETKGTISFSNVDSKTEIYLNGVRTKLNGINAEIELDKEYTIVIKKYGHKKFEVGTPVLLTKSEPFTSIKIPKLEKEQTGFLSTSMNFASGSQIEYKVNGKNVKHNLPLRNLRVPAGSYEGVIKNSLLGTERKVHFTIKENKRNYLE